MDLFQKCIDFTAVDEAKAAGIYPYCPTVSSAQGRSTIMDGMETIMVGSSNYLGLSADRRVIQAAQEALEKYGTGCTGTRLFNGTTDLHLELEKEIARFVGKEASAVFPTGFQSNVTIIESIANENDIIFGDVANHESILTGITVSRAEYIPFPHNDYSALETMLAEADSNKGKLIIVDGVYSFDGTLADLPKLIELKRKYGARLMVDDSHGFGSVGISGRGTCEHYGLMDEVDILMATFSKCFASIGGFVAADKEVVNYITHTAGAYTNTAALPPVNVATILASLKILQQEPWRAEQARENAEYIRGQMRDKNIPFIEGAQAPIVSVKMKDEISSYICQLNLKARGVYANVLADNLVIRTCYNAMHTRDDLNYVVKQFEAVLNM